MSISRHKERSVHARVSRDHASSSPGIDDEIFLQPWFLPKDIFLEIRRLLPSAQLLKLRYYFEDYGCLKCGRANVMYRSNGLCENCSIVVRSRIVLSLKRRFDKLGRRCDGTPLQKYLSSLKRANFKSGQAPHSLRSSD